MREGEMRIIASLMDRVLAAPEDLAVAKRVRAEVQDLTGGFPLYPTSYHRADLD
jgi:glycine/serine hydroxymethyltransferase